MVILTGSSTLGAAPVFSCSATICYASDKQGVGKGTDAQFREVQALINRFASSAKFNPIPVDGFIGAGTVNALNAVLAWLKLSIKWSAVAATLTPMAANKETLAKTVLAVSASLSTIAQDLKLTAVAPPPSVSVSPGGGGTSTTITTVAPPPGIETLFPGAGVPDVSAGITTAAGKALPKWPFYLGGAALAIGLGYLLVNSAMKKSDVGVGGLRELSRHRRRY